jgi:hypothetical protein
MCGCPDAQKAGSFLGTMRELEEAGCQDLGRSDTCCSPGITRSTLDDFDSTEAGEHTVLFEGLSADLWACAYRLKGWDDARKRAVEFEYL